MNDNTFKDYRLLILQALEDAKTERREIRSDIRSFRDEVNADKLATHTMITDIRVRLALYGASAGAVAAAVVAAVAQAVMN